MNNYNGWKDTENLFTPKEGVDDFLKKLSEKYEIYISTTRDRENVYKWMIRHHLYEYIQDVTNIKEPAFAYIDDRAIKFDGDYSKILSELENFKPYWKDK